MGARFWLGWLLLAGILGLSLLSHTVLQRMHSQIAGELSQAAALILAGDRESGVELAQKAKQEWEKNWKLTASGIDQNPMDNIDGIFSQLEIYQKEGTPAEFAACCQQLSSLVQSVAEAHKPSWWNIL